MKILIISDSSKPIDYMVSNVIFGTDGIYIYEDFIKYDSDYDYFIGYDFVKSVHYNVLGWRFIIDIK